MGYLTYVHDIVENNHNIFRSINKNDQNILLSKQRGSAGGATWPISIKPDWRVCSKLRTRSCCKSRADRKPSRDQPAIRPMWCSSSQMGFWVFNRLGFRATPNLRACGHLGSKSYRPKKVLNWAIWKILFLMPLDMLNAWAWMQLAKILHRHEWNDVPLKFVGIWNFQEQWLDFDVL